MTIAKEITDLRRASSKRGRMEERARVMEVLNRISEERLNGYEARLLKRIAKEVAK